MCVKNESGEFMNDEEIKQFAKKISVFMYISCVLWIFVILLQLIIGLVTLIFGYGLATLGLMVYNIIVTVKYFKNIKFIKSVSNRNMASVMIDYFEDSIPVCWLFMFINLILGGFIGFVGNLYELILAYYVKSKKNDLLNPISSFNERNAAYEEI